MYSNYKSKNQRNYVSTLRAETTLSIRRNSVHAKYTQTHTHMHNGILFRHGKEGNLSFVIKLVKLEDILLLEINQKEKGFPVGWDNKESACNVRDLAFISR